MAETQHEGFYTFDELRGRGWHAGTIRHLFGNPSKTIYQDAGRTELYSSIKVQQMEAAPSFERIQKENAHKSHERYKEQLLEAYRTTVRVRVLPLAELRNQALLMYNRKHFHDPHKLPIISPPGFWEQICVDFLVSGYQEIYEWDYRRTKITKVEVIKMDKLLRAVSEAYPLLEVECKKRLEALSQRDAKTAFGPSSDAASAS